MRELELKLEIAPGQTAQLSKHPLLAKTGGARGRQLSVYFDTKKGKLRKAGYTLRIRQKGDRYVQTVKPDADSAGLFDRDEWEVDVAGPEPTKKALANTPLDGLLTERDLAKLQPVVRSDVERTIWLVTHAGARLEIILDRGEIQAGGRTARVDEVEIELLDGNEEALFSAVKLISEGIAVKLGVLSKAERGFALADDTLHKIAKAAPVRLNDRMTAADGITVIVQSCLRQYRLNEPLVLDRRDSEALHQVRIAMRRLRAALSLFGPVLRDEAFSALRDELRWFTSQLGEARNLDVYLAGLDREDPRTSDIERRREDAYDAVAAAMNSDRFRRLMLDLVDWLHTGAWRRGKKAALPLKRVATRRLNSRWREITTLGARIAALEEEPLHRLRIDVKKLRYGLEFLHDLHASRPRRRTRMLAELEGLQEELGHLNDLATAGAITDSLQSVADPKDDAAPQPTDSLPSAGLNEGAAHLQRAENHFQALVAIGPYWR